MSFKKGNIPYNKSNDLLFNQDTFSYKNEVFKVTDTKRLYLEENVQKIDLSKLLNIPIHKLNKIFEHYNLWKSKSLSNKNVVKNIDYVLNAQKSKKTKLERYGDENYNNIEKRKQTCLEKYGKDNIFKTDKFKSDMIKLNQEKYGCNYNSQSQEVKDKKKSTCQKHFGTNCPFQNEEIKEKIKQTNIRKYGVEYPMQNKDIMNKQKSTNIKKYNREYGFDYNKSKQFYKEKYGVDYYTQTLEYHQKAKKHYIYKNETFDSFPELCVYIYAKENNIDIERCPVEFSYLYGGIKHIYIPDFRYNNKLIEIKGDHFFENGKMINPFDRTRDALYEAKHQCGLKNKVCF